MATIPTKHPFEIESVVENIFNYLRLKEIIKLRIVCKLWDVVGTKRLVDRIDAVRIKFGSNFSMHRPDPHKTIDNFLRMEESFRFKFSNFATFYFESDLNGKIPKAEETERFLYRYGQHVKKIKFDLCDKNCWRFLSDVLTTRAPNVEELHLQGYSDYRSKKLFSLEKPELKLKTITFSSYDEYEEPIYSHELLTDLFQCSPHLECLVIALDMEEIEDRATNHQTLILETLANVGNISNLKHLELEGTYEAYAVLAKSYKEAPLKIFSAPLTQIVDPIKTLEYIEIFLEDHKDTWTTLDLKFPCVDEWMDGITFPRMINLTCLYISDWCIGEEELEEGNAPLEPINFIQQFPNLVTLVLNEDPKTSARTFFDSVKLFPGQSPLLSLRNLTLPPQFHSSVLRRIGNIFPNVTKLELAVQTIDALKQLWITWPQLKKLTVTIVAAVSFGSTSLDSIFTGIPDKSLTALNNRRVIPVAVKSLPYIGTLKKLTHLTIKGRDPFGLYKANETFNADLKITDHTARLVLSNFKELVFLRISSDRYMISSSCVQDLCNALDLHQVEDEGALRLVKYQWQKEICIYD